MAPGLLTVAGDQAWSRVTRQVPGPTVTVLRRLTALCTDILLCCSVNTGTVAAREMRADTVNGCTLTPQISAVPATDHTTGHSSVLQFFSLQVPSAARCAAVRGRETASLVPLLPVFFPRLPPAPPRALALYQLTRIHFRLRLRHKSVTSRNLSLLCLHNDPKH